MTLLINFSIVEHRNMPVEDAMLLISRNFEAYMKGEQMAPDPSALSLLDRHPVPIQVFYLV